MKIEYDIPLPPPRGGRRKQRWEEFSAPDGDKLASSFFPIPKEAKDQKAREAHSNSLNASANGYGKKQTPRWKFTVRFVTENKVDGVRVWRTQ